jgi:hypothetical protein
MILLTVEFKYNLHQRHFNLFILGLFLLTYAAVIFFWLTRKRNLPENEQRIK